MSSPSSSASAPSASVSNADTAPIGRTGDIVDLVICVCSGIGALIIIVPYLLSKHNRKLRHSLILGLATADLISNSTVIASTAYLVNGGDFTTGAAVRACTFLGYALSAGLYAQHMWNLAILAVTYMILVHPLSNTTLLLERKVMWLWPIIWIIALALNAIPWTITGFGYSNGYCYMARRGSPIFSGLWQVTPRSAVVLIILVLYTRLFFFLRRTNFFTKYGRRSRAESSSDSAMSNRDVEKAQRSERHRSSQPSFARNNRAATRFEPGLMSSDRHSVGRHGQMELQDYGFLNSAAATPNMPGRELPPSPTRPMAAAPLTTPAAPLPMFDAKRSSYVSDTEYSTGDKSASVSADSPSVEKDGRTSPSLLSSLPVYSGQASGDSFLLGDKGTSGTSSAESSSGGRKGPTSAADRGDSDEEEDDDDIPDYHSWAGLKSSQPSKKTRDFNMSSAPQQGADEPLTPIWVSANTTSVIDALRSGPPASGKAAAMLGSQDEGGDTRHQAKQTYNADSDDNFAWGQNVTAAGMGSRRGSLVPARGATKSGRYDHTTSARSSDVNAVESTGSTLNRQASALLLLYPAAYVILFSVSVIRICRDMAHPEYSLKPSDNLRVASRWLVFSQGIMDCIIFKVIEAEFRRRMKKKRARASGEQGSRSQSQPQTAGAWISNTCERIWKRHIKPRPEESRRPSVG